MVYLRFVGSCLLDCLMECSKGKMAMTVGHNYTKSQLNLSDNRSYLHPYWFVGPTHSLSATRSYTSHRVLNQPPGPPPAIRSYTSHQVLHQPPGPTPAIRSSTSHQVLHQPSGPTPAKCLSDLLIFLVSHFT